MKSRRIIAICLVVLGGILLYVAPETVGDYVSVGGFVLIAIGVVVEAVGIYLEHKR